MSMPVIAMPTNPVSTSQAVSDLLESIALEETGLSHILNAEGEKIQAAIAYCNGDICKLLEVNDSVTGLVHAITNLEIILKDKLELISNNLYCTVRYDTPRDRG